MTIVATGVCLLGVAAAAAKLLVDARARDKALRYLMQIATSDILTGLPNRLSFDCEFSRWLADPNRIGGFAVVMIDLTRFKFVNDTYGHQAGDELLIALAARFREALQPGQEFIARLGGDEFAVLLPSAEMPDLSLRLERITAVFKDPFRFQRFTTHASANIGVALAPADGRDADTLLAQADLAMYCAKQAHSPRPCFYTASMDQAVRERRDLIHRLRTAIGTDDLRLHYQPQCAVQTRAITGYEALCRWQAGDGRYVPPTEFIPLAEETGEIVRLGTWVLTRACRDAMLWPEPLKIAVNLSPLQLTDASLASTVARVLHETGLPPYRLELDVTDAAIVKDRTRALDQMTKLKALGVTLALDGFGVGSSSFDILRDFRFDRIKLGPSFMAGAVGNPQAIAILSAVTLLGRKLDMSVLAGGIETPEQLDLAAREGCAGVQGHLLGRPGRHLADPTTIRRTMATVLPQADAVSAPTASLTEHRKRLLLPAT